mmetsp:Transcript_38654/g.67835  ORF Transcript_38654/g.67835 Transcript_38654/m.67835 type:complete len:92 (-) Transcript_38654:209-484(-)
MNYASSSFLQSGKVSKITSLFQGKLPSFWRTSSRRKSKHMTRSRREVNDASSAHHLSALRLTNRHCPPLYPRKPSRKILSYIRPIYWQRTP